MNKVPRREQLMNPVVTALKQLGGSGSVDEINNQVIEHMKLPEDTLTVLHDPQNSNQTELQYELAWARTYLKRVGILVNRGRGLWALTEKADSISVVNGAEILRTVHRQVRQERLEKEKEKSNKSSEELPEADTPEEALLWRTKLHHLLTKKLTPAAFERLIQRVLRESGFIQVEVTGRTGDGGIDGKGIARIHGFMSFHVVFQCKRWQGVVGASEIRDFRGAMVGRADKGLFITTGTFSRDAIKEATRDGAPPIDLVDGDLLADKLKELKLGVVTSMIESVAVDATWFESI
ncbi:MAG: restriction endonuclease [Verrucomicrobia bacterium]|nr:restriction endonuclease [Verrucomicrobiota bacterium]